MLYFGASQFPPLRCITIGHSRASINYATSQLAIPNMQVHHMREPVCSFDCGGYSCISTRIIERVLTDLQIRPNALSTLSGVIGTSIQTPIAL